MPQPLSSGLPKDFLKPCLLLLLREGSAHGYELIERVEAFGFDHSDPGALYRALRRLESERLVASSWEPSVAGPPKRVYELTESGVEELDRRASDLAEAQRRIDAFIDRYLLARRANPANRRRRAVAGRFAAHQAAARERPPSL